MSDTDKGAFSLQLDAGRCPECNAIVDGHTSVSSDKAKPTAGDVSVCVYCVTPLRYEVEPGGSLKLARCEIESLEPELGAALTKTVAAIRVLKEKHPDAFAGGSKNQPKETE